MIKRLCRTKPRNCTGAAGNKRKAHRWSDGKAYAQQAIKGILATFVSAGFE